MLEWSADSWDSHHQVANGNGILHHKDYIFLHKGSIARVRAYFGQGRIPILLDNVACSGTESRLIDCTYSSHTLDCDHGEDAGVTCQPGSSEYT